MATVLTDGVRSAEFLISEANGHRSREQVVVTVGAGASIKAGTVVGALTATGKYTARTQGTSDGAQNAKGILYANLYNPGVAPADFKATIINCDAEVQGETMDANDGVAATVLAELLALGIKVRGVLGNTA